MNDFKPTFSLSDVKLNEAKILYDGYFRVNLYDFSHKKFDGSYTSSVLRELFFRDPCVAIILYDPKLDNVILIEQFRVGSFACDHQNSKHSPWLLEIVAGVIDSGETPLSTAEREVEEEAGLKVIKLIPIYQYFSTPGGSNEFVHLFCGIVDSTDAGGIFGLHTEDEDIKVHVIKSADIFSALDNNKISNATTIISIQWLRANIHDLRKDNI